MTEASINRSLYHLFNNYNYKLFNAFVFDWECDFFAISTSNYIIEIEIKIDRSDFKNDFKKTIWFGNGPVLKHDYLADSNITYKPNKFYYACPDGLIKPDEIPENYGLIYIQNHKRDIVKQAKFLHKTDLMQDNRLLKSLLNKFYYRNALLKSAMDLYEWDIKYGQKRLYAN